MSNSRALRRHRFKPAKKPKLPEIGQRPISPPVRPRQPADTTLRTYTTARDPVFMPAEIIKTVSGFGGEVPPLTPEQQERMCELAAEVSKAWREAMDNTIRDATSLSALWADLIRRT